MKAPISRNDSANSHGSPGSRKWMRKPAMKPGPRAGSVAPWREAGRLRENSHAAYSPAAPSTPSAMRHEAKSLMKADSTRPVMPPKALPLMYMPIDRPRDVGSISSPRYAIATAGKPPSIRPMQARSATRWR